MIISPGFFFIFDIFIFQGVTEVKGQKIAQDNKKILSVELHVSGTIHHMILINGTLCKRIICSDVFLCIFQNLIFGINSAAKEQKMT